MSNVGIIPTGAEAKVFNAALYSEARRLETLTNELSHGTAPKSTDGIGKFRSDDDHPIVVMHDLQTQAGRSISYDVVHDITGYPTMGSRSLSGRGSRISLGTDEIVVNQGRKMVHDSDAMLQTLSKHNSTAIAKKLLNNWFSGYCEQSTQIHTYGARGTYSSIDDKIPLESHPEYEEIMINEVLAPTYSRHFYAGQNDSIDQIDSSDKFSLEIVDRLNLIIKEMRNPIRKIRLKNAKGEQSKAFYLQYVSPRQWYDLEQNATTRDWQQMAAKVTKRMAGFTHPILTGEYIMKGDILVKPLDRAIGWSAGDKVKVSKNDKAATTEHRVVQTEVHRSVLLGAQALCIAYGSNKNVKSTFSMNEEDTDHKDKKEISLAFVHGKKAIRLPDAMGNMNDVGRIVVDTSVSTNF